MEYINHRRIEYIIQENGLKAKNSCKEYGRYSKAYKQSIHPNHLNREYDVKKVQIGDIADISTKDVYEYLMGF